ncbi:serine/threonine dehydratase [Iodidimonas nitroreducens]|uniref:Serine/threonine dehydratase n=1 Tax=Iodidimonas nitroreducens TaxID=1236968 RepID=A0A5A7N5R8_9PROT|nr:threonine/serine dehydratase [Iodidimonas nitroreducens]GAK33053.1 putative serine racemase [alpha proteobacterium Q-1]GER03428.1 serine/threonine dehydratase [Iodidimonas nitroreducens]
MHHHEDDLDLIGIADIEDAAEALAGVALRTPLMEHPILNARAGGRVLVKAECLQRTGSFKIRGAYNRLSRLSADERAAGVVAFSSGNHAQGVAEAARRLGVRAQIVMPHDAPAIKRENTRALGAEIIAYDRYTQNREQIAMDLCAQSGAILVPSYDDRQIIAGQGTVGLEIADQAKKRGCTLDAALICVGGGGLIAGSATALKAAFPAIAVHGVEPLGFDDTARSLKAGKRVANDLESRSICDALLAPMPGALTFAHNRQLLESGVVVTDDEVKAAMAFAFERLKIVVEPGGAVALAAVLAHKIETRDRIIAIVLSGGNIGLQDFSALMA